MFDDRPRKTISTARASDKTFFAILLGTAGLQVRFRAGGDDWMRIAAVTDQVFIGQHAGLPALNLQLFAVARLSSGVAFEKVDEQEKIPAGRRPEFFIGRVLVGKLMVNGVEK
jgi:hypothetical protein